MAKKSTDQPTQVSKTAAQGAVTPVKANGPALDDAVIVSIHGG